MTALSEETDRPQGQGEARSKPLSVTAKRTLVALIGGVLALSGGAGMAFAFRVSPDLTPTDPADMTVQDEVPSIAAARAYALGNPPNYVGPVKALASEETVATAEPTVDDTGLQPPDDSDDARKADAPQSGPRPYVAAFNDNADTPTAARADDGPANPS